MKIFLAFLVSLAVLAFAPSFALAGGKSKVTTCTTSNSYFGSKTTCRTKS